ncbi:MAG: tetratricopeptide repeat protein [Rubrivivax sp.]|nr:tetratricopeptide repeat protein [Rubrivivax sp.]
MAASETAQAPLLQLWGVPSLLPAPAAPAVAFAPERRFQLLLLLALEHGQWLDRDRIAALLWPAHALNEARRNLRKVVFRARAVPGAQALEANDHALRWHIRTDVQALQEACRRGDAVHGLALRRGAPLQGVDDPGNGALAEVLAAARERIDEVWLNAAHEQLRAQTLPPAQAVAARRILEVDALDEPAMAALLKAETASGRPAEAQAAYRRYAARLVQELGVEPSRALRDLVHGAPPPTGAGPSPPQRRTSDAFVGRGLELAEAQALLGQPACRALTLLGPGGIGKSRLAQQLRARCAARFAGGVHWVALQDTAQLPAALASLAQTLGIATQDTGDPIDQILRQLPQEPLLLVLDNAEHLGGLPEVLQRLLDGAPALVLLLTSRARLQLRNEWVLPLAGLAVPDEDSRDLEAAASFDAVRLFEQCALAAQRDFVLARHLPAVIEIVEAVGGMPLAIELAAGWVRLLPPEQVAQDLRGSIDLLERDPAARNALARPDHASLRAVLDGTWQLLAPREREALARLSVFQGGFMRAAAQAVAACSLPLLSSLVDKGLLTVGEAGRFAMHPVVAAFAAERLAALADVPALRSAHAAHYAQLLAALAPHARGDQRLLIDGITAEFANGRAAWHHAVRHRITPLIDAMAPAWRTFYESRGRLVEGIGEMRLALALPLDDAGAQRALSKVRHALSTFLYRKGDLQEAQAVAEGALALAEDCGEHAALQGCLGNIGLCLWHAGRAAEALAAFERELALAERHGDRYGAAVSLSHIAIAEKALGHYERALALNLRALATERELGNQRGVASKLNNIGNLHRALRQWTTARQYFVDGLQHCQVYGLTAAAPYLRLNLGLTETELGDTASARRHLDAVVQEMRDAGQLQVELSVELGLARIDIAQGDAAAALGRLRRVARLAAAKAFHTHPVQVASIYGEWLAARGEHLAAAGIWHMASTQAALDEMDREGALTLLAGLQLDAAETAQMRRTAPTLDQVLSRLEGPHPGIDAASGPGAGV